MSAEWNPQQSGELASASTTSAAASPKKTMLLTNSRPSPQDLKRSLAAQPKLSTRPVPAPSKYFTQRCGTPLPPPPRPEPKKSKQATAAAVCKPATPPAAVDVDAAGAGKKNKATALGGGHGEPTVVEYCAEPSANKSVHVLDRRHRGMSRNVLGGFFNS